MSESTGAVNMPTTKLTGFADFVVSLVPDGDRDKAAAFMRDLFAKSHLPEQLATIKTNVPHFAHDLYYALQLEIFTRRSISSDVSFDEWITRNDLTYPRTNGVAIDLHAMPSL
jgi:hypothetical protein